MNDRKPIVLLDTDVVSNMLRGTAIGLEYLRLSHGYQTAISFITSGELLFGARRRHLGARRHLHLELFLTECPIIVFEKGLESFYARVMFERERMGKRLEKADGWIATTAIYNDIPLMTHDSDFVGTPGLRIITASEEARAAQVRLPVVSPRPLIPDATCRCSF